MFVFNLRLRPFHKRKVKAPKQSKKIGTDMKESPETVLNFRLILTGIYTDSTR